MEAEKLPLPARLMLEWLKTRVTGCQFARAIAKKGGDRAAVRLSVVRNALNDPALPELLHATLIQAAAESAGVLFVFPHLRVDEDIADLAMSLTRNPAFTIQQQPWPPEGASRTEILFLLRWLTPSGLPSRAMGFAPSGSMPITRRAPFVSLFVWPGGLENHIRGTKTKEGKPFASVGIVDMKHSFDPEDHQNLWTGSLNEKAAVDQEEPSFSASLRYVSFCLSDRVKGRLGF